MTVIRRLQTCVLRVLSERLSSQYAITWTSYPLRPIRLVQSSKDSSWCYRIEDRSSIYRSLVSGVNILAFRKRTLAEAPLMWCDNYVPDRIPPRNLVISGWVRLRFQILQWEQPSTKRYVRVNDLFDQKQLTSTVYPFTLASSSWLFTISTIASRCLKKISRILTLSPSS